MMDRTNIFCYLFSDPLNRRHFIWRLHFTNTIFLIHWSWLFLEFYLEGRLTLNETFVQAPEKLAWIMKMTVLPTQPFGHFYIISFDNKILPHSHNLVTITKSNIEESMQCRNRMWVAPLLKLDLITNIAGPGVKSIFNIKLVRFGYLFFMWQLFGIKQKSSKSITPYIDRKKTFC